MPKETLTHRKPDIETRVRRGYFECRYGQLHVHNAIPAGGGFEEGTPLLCVHHAAGSGHVFEQFLALGGRDRSVYAPDLPGFGESESPPSRPAIADYAGALGDFLQTMRFRQVDVLGYQSGGLIAGELAIACPKQVRRVVMVSPAVTADVEHDGSRRLPWTVAEDGSHVLTEWRRITETYGSAVSLEMRTRALADKLRAASHAAWLQAAVQQYASRERLAMITQPVIVLRPKDNYWDATARIRELLPRARCVDLSGQGGGLFQTAAETVAESVKEFLRG